MPPYIAAEPGRASRCAPGDAAQHEWCTAVQANRILPPLVHLGLDEAPTVRTPDGDFAVRSRYQCSESDAPAASGRRIGAIATPGFLLRVPVGELSAVCTSRVSMISETTAPSRPTPPTT
jgi:hypothetical protein